MAASADATMPSVCVSLSVLHNSRVYKDDPTILAWNLINEPRCESWLPANKDCNAHVQVT